MAEADVWTVRRILGWMVEDFRRRELDSPRLDAELLVSHVLGVQRVQLYMDLDRPLSEVEREGIRALVKRRREHEPVAYLVGHKEFWGRTFKVDPAVLIPRPDTETLVERALSLLPPDSTGPVLDLCTGSGAIGLTLAAERPHLSVDLTDISADALRVAKDNAEALGVSDRVRFYEGDLCAALEPGGASYSLITINPPYVTESEMAELDPDILRHEPEQALVAGPDGFLIHRRLLQELGAWAEQAAVLIEVGAGQAARLQEEASELSWVASSAVHLDLGKIERVVELRGRAYEPPPEPEPRVEPEVVEPEVDPDPGLMASAEEPG